MANAPANNAIQRALNNVVRSSIEATRGIITAVIVGITSTIRAIFVGTFNSIYANVRHLTREITHFSLDLFKSLTSTAIRTTTDVIRFILRMTILLLLPTLISLAFLYTAFTSTEAHLSVLLDRSPTGLELLLCSRALIAEAVLGIVIRLVAVMGVNKRTRVLALIIDVLRWSLGLFYGLFLMLKLDDVEQVNKRVVKTYTGIGLLVLLTHILALTWLIVEKPRAIVSTQKTL